MPSKSMSDSLKGPKFDIHERGVRGLECRVGARPFVLDASLIDQLIVVSVSPLPLARAPISGLASHDGTIVVILRLVSDQGGARRRDGVKAVLLTQRVEGKARWALEVDEVHSFVDGIPSAEEAWLDVDRMVRELDSARGER